MKSSERSTRNIPHGIAVGTDSTKLARHVVEFTDAVAWNFESVPGKCAGGPSCGHAVLGTVTLMDCFFLKLLVPRSYGVF